MFTWYAKHAWLAVDLIAGVAVPWLLVSAELEPFTLRREYDEIDLRSGGRNQGGG